MCITMDAVYDYFIVELTFAFCLTWGSKRFLKYTILNYLHMEEIKVYFQPEMKMEAGEDFL